MIKHAIGRLKPLYLAAGLLVVLMVALGWTVFHLSVSVAVATGCWVVMVMKGPPRQADSYPPEGRSSPLKPGPDHPPP